MVVGAADAATAASSEGENAATSGPNDGVAVGVVRPPGRCICIVSGCGWGRRGDLWEQEGRACPSPRLA